MLDSVRTSIESIRDAARFTPGWLVSCSLLVLAQSLLPAVQVILLESLVERIADDPWVPLIGLTIVVGLMFPLGQVGLAAMQRMAMRLRLRYRTDLAYAAARLSPSQLARPDVTTALEASQTATAAMDDVAGKTLRVLGAGITSAMLCVVIWAINPWSGLLVVAALVPTVLAFTAVSRAEAKGWPKFAVFERRANYATEQLVQQRPGTELSVLGSGDKVAALVASLRGDAMRIVDKLTRTAMLMELVAACGTALLFGGALVTLVLGGASGAGAAAAVAGTISGLNAIRLCGYAFGSIVTTTPQAMIYRRFLASIPPAPKQQVIRNVGSVRLEHVSYSYPGAAEAALTDVSIRAERGEMIALVGVNGAGKTTAINTLIGLLTPTEGRVLIDGEVISAGDRLGYCGLLVQEFGKFEFTLGDVVRLGSPADGVPDEDVRQALASAEAAGFTSRMKLDTQLGQQWGGVGISGGQWQRLALARIYLRDAGIWILDEPTSAIDAEAERQIFAELSRTRRDRITIVVSHRAWTLREMDRIYVIDGGRVVQEGRYEELLAVPEGRFARIFEGQAGENSVPRDRR
ncbi:ATP-binding cassette domain-containing protein [Kribbella sp. CA-294648]|uniref:ATP-binding cassette domain-containing protein n=1 Tax=Kribbella sp. CA-294648 TaxID=3239948 RepID=UPI003D937B90